MKISIQKLAAGLLGSRARHNNTALRVPWGPCLSFFGPGLVQSEVSLAGLTDVSVRAGARAGMNSACGHVDR